MDVMIQMVVFLPIYSSGLGQVLKLEPIPEDPQSDSSTGPSEFHFSAIKSPASSLACDISTSLSLESPSTRIRRPSSKNLKQPLHLQPSQNGLNSILDGSPSNFQAAFGGKTRIKRESLRSFYGNSVNSPNLTEVPSSAIIVRRSPRLNKGEWTILCLLNKAAQALSWIGNVPESPTPTF